MPTDDLDLNGLTIRDEYKRNDPPTDDAFISITPPDTEPTMLSYDQARALYGWLNLTLAQRATPRRPR